MCRWVAVRSTVTDTNIPVGKVVQNGVLRVPGLEALETSQAVSYPTQHSGQPTL